MRYSILLVTLLVSFGGYAASGQTVIPRYTGLLDTTDIRTRWSLHYDPADLPLRWLPNGDILVAHTERYTEADVGDATCAGSGVFIISATHPGPARALATGHPACDAVISDGGLSADPGGHWIVYSVDVRINKSRLVRLDLETGRTDTLPTGCAVYLEHPSVSPDGQRIAAHGLCHDRHEDYTMYMMNADGTHLHRVIRAHDTLSELSPAWSPDGKQVVFVHRRWDKKYDHEDITITDTSGSVVRGFVLGDEPAWSPDGRWIAFLPRDTTWGDDGTIHIVRPGGVGHRIVFTNQVQTTFDRGWGPTLEGRPRGPLVWSPDGSALLFTREFDRGTSIWRLDVKSGNVTPLTAPPNHSTDPDSQTAATRPNTLRRK